MITSAILSPMCEHMFTPPRPRSALQNSALCPSDRRLSCRVQHCIVHHFGASRRALSLRSPAQAPTLTCHTVWGSSSRALAELADEADALRANVDGLRALSASLDTFNEAFASCMYVMNMNALTVDWPEVRGRLLSL